MTTGIYKRTDAHRLAMSLGATGHRKGIVVSKETRLKMSIAGKKKSQDVREKISEATKRNWQNPVLRAKFTNKKLPTGIKHWKWISDRTKLAKRQERSDVAYKEWRRQVWLRDGWKCKIANPDCAGRIEAHHILGWTEYPELRYEVNNGITLCHFHHPRKRKDEVILSPYFQELIKVN